MENKFTVRDVMLTLSYHYDGEYRRIKEAISAKEPINPQETIAAYQKLKSQFFTLLDESYPEYFTGMADPPFILYYYGNLSLLSSPLRISCVGTRNPTLYQAETSRKLIQELEDQTENKTVIVSGMARGLDSVYMRAAMGKGAPVIGYSACGIDTFYPSESADIYEYCKTGKGLVLSEYPRDLSPKPKHFVFRNRLIVATGKLLFVGGGDFHSGTSASVTLGINLGKDILALPCNLGEKDMTNSLIRDGAGCVCDIKDLLVPLKEYARF